MGRTGNASRAAMTPPVPTIIIIGATATGKSELGVRLAESLRTEIINADSRQIYRHLDIGTAKPSPAQRRRVVHHLIDVVPPDGMYDAAQFARQAHRLCQEAQARRTLPLVVGGCGLYLNALVNGLADAPEASPAARARLLQRAAADGLEVLYDELRRRDPLCAAAVHPHDRVRIIRALEVYEQTGETMTALRRRHAHQPPRLHPWFIGVRCARPALRRRIAERAHDMVRRGLFEEVEGLVARGYDERCRPLQGFSYQHLLAAVRGGLDRQEALHRLIRDTQRYAKRQETWFRRLSNVQWFDIDAFNPDQLHAAVVAFLRQAGVFEG